MLVTSLIKDFKKTEITPPKEVRDIYDQAFPYIWYQVYVHDNPQKPLTARALLPILRKINPLVSKAIINNVLYQKSKTGHFVQTITHDKDGVVKGQPTYTASKKAKELRHAKVINELLGYDMFAMKDLEVIEETNY